MSVRDDLKGGTSDPSADPDHQGGRVAEAAMHTVTRYRIALVREADTQVPPRANLSSPRGVFRFMQEFLAETDREEFVALCLSTRDDLLGYNVVSEVRIPVRFTVMSQRGSCPGFLRMNVTTALKPVGMNVN